MSAVDPVDPQEHVNHSGPATVIDISTHGRTAAKGRWKPVSSPRPDATDSWQWRADDVEMTFNEDHLTLSDDDTKAAYTITLGVVRHMLKGAHAKGVIDESQLATLDAVMEGMLAVPRLV